MENQTLYSKRGGGYTTAINTKAMAGRATWPFAKLVLRQNDISFDLFSNHINLSYKDIKSVGVTKSGYVTVVANDLQNSFAFTWLGQSKIIKIFQNSGVTLDPDVPSNLPTAKLSTLAQLSFVVIFAVVVIVIIVSRA